jgi:primosomal replication protein N
VSNQVEISGEIIKLYPTRYTLQKLPVVSFVLNHESIQLERGSSKMVNCRLFCIYIEDDSLLNLNLINQKVNLTGFLSLNAKSQLVLHVKKLDFLKAT